MNDIDPRVQRGVKEIMGNEALLGMLETDAATEMLHWGVSAATTLAKRTEGLDDAAADLVILPGLKAVRQAMRSIGNWAAGNYVDPASRIELRDKLFENFKMIFGEEAGLPPVEEMDALLNQVDDKLVSSSIETNESSHQLILKLIQSLEGSN